MKYLSIKLLNWTLLFALCIFLITCKKELAPKPIAEFSYSPASNLVAPVTIFFTNTSQNANAYTWVINGQTFTTKDISFQFSQGGTYLITLTATGEGGTNAYSRSITIASPPVAVILPTAGFNYSPTSNITAPAKITFTNTSKNANSYAWDFGDGTSSADTNPTKEFSKAGTYKVKLFASNSAGTNNYSVDITINAAVPVNQGFAIFWTSEPKGSRWTKIDVYLEGTFAETITDPYTIQPGCGNNAGTIIKSPGKYAYTAKSDKGDTWSGNITVPNNGCVFIPLEFTNTVPTNSSVNTHKYVKRYNYSYDSKDFTPVFFTLKETTDVVVYFASRNNAQAALLTATEYKNFNNGGTFNGWAIFNNISGYQSLKLAAGTYYIGVRNNSTSKDNYYSYEVWPAIQIPATDKYQFQDVYFKNVQSLAVGKYLYQEFSIETGFRYFFNGCYSFGDINGYFIPKDQLNNFINGSTFTYYKDYVVGADGGLAADEIKLPIGSYYFVFKNTRTLPLSITYLMERWRKI